MKSSDRASYPGRVRGRLFYGYVIVALALLIMLLAYGTRTTFGVFFKPMIAEFDWTRALTSGAFTISMLTQGVVGIFTGRLSDRIGPKLAMTLCCFFLGVGFLLLSQTAHSWQLYLFYGIVIGVGMGGVFVVLLSTVARWFTKRRGTMTGIVVAGMGLGSLIMAPVSSWLISVYQWRSSYLIVGSVVLVLGVSASWFLRRGPAGDTADGAVKAPKPDPAPGKEGLSLGGASRTPAFWMAAGIYFCLGYCVFTINVHIVPHITDIGIAAAGAAAVLAVAGGVQTAGNVLLGGAADRVGNRRVLAIGFILSSAALFGLLGIGQAWLFYVFAVFFGLGVGGITVMESTVVAELFGMKSHGLILGVVSAAFTVGGALGPLAAGYIFDVTGSYHLAFLIAASLSALGLVLSVLLRPIRRAQVAAEAAPSGG